MVLFNVLVVNVLDDKDAILNMYTLINYVYLFLL